MLNIEDLCMNSKETKCKYDLGIAVYQICPYRFQKESNKIFINEKYTKRVQTMPHQNMSHWHMNYFELKVK